jgi:hypothetical protein
MEEYEKTTVSKQSSKKEKLREMKPGNGSPNRSPSKYNGPPIRQFKKVRPILYSWLLLQILNQP